MKIGRRRSLILACGIGFIGLVITWWMNFVNLVIGRLIYGFATGLFSSIAPRY